jgi:hypothetical protein
VEQTEQKIWIKEIFIIPLICIPFIGIQSVVGIFINAILLLAVFSIGFKKAMPLAFMPSLAALLSGFMPVLFLVPFIGISNLILMMLFEKYKKNLLKAVLIAAIGKAFYFFLIGLFLPLCGSLLGMIQLATALFGGLVFLGANKIFKLHRF